jgi:hypothetical protein
MKQPASSAVRTQAPDDHPLTQHEMVLLSLARASKWTTEKVPYEDLVLQAWRDFPQVFSLRNHPEHPDASDIHKRLYQTLKPAGLVVTLGNKIFRLTEQGVERAQALSTALERHSGAIPANARLGRDERNFVEHALSSRAFSTWLSGESERLIDYDARMFFRFSTGTPVDERKLRVEFAERAIGKAQALGMESAEGLMTLTALLVQRFPHLLGER